MKRFIKWLLTPEDPDLFPSEQSWPQVRNEVARRAVILLLITAFFLTLVFIVVVVGALAQDSRPLGRGADEKENIELRINPKGIGKLQEPAPQEPKFEVADPSRFRPPMIEVWNNGRTVRMDDEIAAVCPRWSVARNARAAVKGSKRAYRYVMACIQKATEGKW